MNVDCEESNGIAKMNAKTKKSIVLVNLMKDYKEIDLSTGDCGEFFSNMMEFDWELGDGDRSEWDKRKADVICQIVNEYEEQIVKVQRCFLDHIESLDEALTVPINQRDVGILVTPFHKVFWVAGDFVCL